MLNIDALTLDIDAWCSNPQGVLEHEQDCEHSKPQVKAFGCCLPIPAPRGPPPHPQSSGDNTPLTAGSGEGSVTFCRVTKPRASPGSASHKAQTVPIPAPTPLLGPPAAQRGVYGAGGQPCLSQGGGTSFQLLSGNKMPFKNEAEELNWLCLEPGCACPILRGLSRGALPVLITPTCPSPRGEGDWYFIFLTCSRKLPKFLLLLTSSSSWVFVLSPFFGVIPKSPSWWDCRM